MAVWASRRFSRRETAKVLGVSISTLNRIFNSGKLRRHRIRGRVWVSEQQLAAYLRSTEEPSRDGQKEIAR